MGMELKTEISQKQILSQRMMQSMEILQMSAQELEAYIEHLALENPMIELSESRPEQDMTRQEELQRKLDWLESTDFQNKVYYQQERSSEQMQDNWQADRKSQKGLADYILAQMVLSDYTRQERAILEFMVLSLDDRGYFTDELSVAANYFSVSEELIGHLLREIQKMDPAGVGARDLKECLLLQLERREHVSAVTEQMVKYHMTDIAKNHLPNVAKKLNVSMDEILRSCDEIRSLNPKPGNSFSSREQLRYISPDVVVVKLENQFEILVNEYRYPGFTISSYYEDLMKHTGDEETKQYLQEKIQQAKWVSSCIAQRTSTLSRVMQALVEKQKDFFLYGTGHKHPMKLVDLARELNLHESTISRAMRGKYLQCSWGIFPINYFLTSVAVKASDTSEEKTPDQIKNLIRTIVNEEDKKKPLSDQAISEKLAEYEVRISRRTVNKYRSEMGIPDKSGRKIWK